MRRTLAALRHVAVRSTHQGAIEAGRRQGYRLPQHPRQSDEDPEMGARRAQQKANLAKRFEAQRHMDVEQRYGQGDYPDMPSLIATKAAVTVWHPIQVFWDILVRKNDEYRYESMHSHLQLFGTAVAWHHFGAGVLEESHGVWYAATTVTYPADADATRRMRVTIRWRIRPEVRREYANVVLVARLPDRLLALQWEKGAGVAKADARYEVVEVSAFYEAVTGAFVMQNRVGTVLADLLDTEEQTEPTEDDYAEHAATPAEIEAAGKAAQDQAWAQQQEQQQQQQQTWEQEQQQQQGWEQQQQQQVWEQQQQGWEQQQQQQQHQQYQQQQAREQQQQGWEQQQQQQQEQQAWAQQQQSWKQQRQQQQQQQQAQREQQHEQGWLQQQQQGGEQRVQRQQRTRHSRGGQRTRRNRGSSDDL